MAETIVHADPHDAALDATDALLSTMPTYAMPADTRDALSATLAAVAEFRALTFRDWLASVSPR